MPRTWALGLFLFTFCRSLSAAPVDTGNWMREIYQNNPDHELRQIMIPGSHDTGTDRMTQKSGVSATLDGVMKIAPKGAVAAWSKTQDRSIGQQLRDGVRYFDLRVEKTSQGWMTYHGLLSNSLVSMLEEVAAFVAAHPQEIVLLDFQSLVNFNNDVTELVSYLQQHPILGSHIAPWGEFGTGVRFRDLWEADRNLILLFDQRRVRQADGSFADSNLVWPRVLQNPWSNTRHTAKVEEDLVNGIRQRPQDLFYVSQAIVTPDAHVVTLGWAQGITSLRDMAVKWMNPKYAALIPRLHDEAIQAGRRVNIIISDFYEESPLIDLCLQYNLGEVQQE